MGFTQITSTNLSTDLSTQIAAGTAANNAVANIITLTVKTVQVADSSYNTWDDTAANTTGGYLVLTGTGFTPNCIVIIGSTTATSTSYVNTTCIRAQTQAFSTGTYNLYVVDTNTGATAIRVNSYSTSSFPAWGTDATLSNQVSNTSFSVSLSANSDSSITYANTTALPAGTTLLANGYFYGTVSIGTQTTYSFTVDAKDAENQDALRTFSMTVTVTPPYKLWVWGFGSNGQLGQNDTIDRSSPTQVGTGTTWNKITGGRFATIATKTDGTLWAWGRNSNGQLGLNASYSDYKSSPMQVGSGTTWNLISMVQYHGIATKTDGTLWLWGRNNFGQLGQNNTIYRSSPVQLGSGTNWTGKISNGMVENSAAISNNGALWMWGRNQFGSLAQNDVNTQRSSPVQVGALTDWSDISLGNHSVSAIKTNGTLWLWGHNNYGTLGINAPGHRSSPTQVGTGTNWSKVHSGCYTTFAIKTDGTLWAWGANFNGQLGLSLTAATYISSPTQVGVLTNWSLVQNNSYSTLAIKTDGTLWGWGKNGNGQLGQNDRVYRSSPIQIGTNTNWSNISPGGEFNIAITAN